MAAAHEQRIVHRDLKPDNVFVVPDPSGWPRIKVLDFGIAKVADAGNVQTATSATLGTATYMAPEQFRSSRDVDHRVDIYALGCMTFELLTGHPPFGGRNLVEQMKAHLDQPPPLASLPPGTPPALTVLIGRMLAKDREQRIGSMPEVAAAVRASMGTPPSSSNRATTTVTAGGGMAPATWVAIALIAVVTAISIALVLLT
jgi:serine/threonine-protein kinase